MITKYLHIKTFVGFLFLLLATVACSNEDEAVIMPSSNESMKLQVITEENATTRTEGDYNLNEDLFVTLDYYFFATAKATDDANTLKLHKSETGLTDNDSHTYNGKFSDAELEAVFGTNPENNATCYVYVIANLPVDKFDEETQTEITEKTITLGQLMHKDFQTTDISKNEAQDSFVMYGGDQVTLSITTEGNVTKKSLYGQVKVKRDAAKVVLTVTSIEELVEVEGEGDVKQYWKPQTGNVHVMFYNGMNKSYIHSQINQGSHYVPGEGEDDCYFSLNKTTGTDNLWRALVATDESKPYENLTHEFPFYTYLSDWSSDHGNKERASYMILVVPWKQVNADGSDISGGGTFIPTYYQIETTPVDEYAYYENTFYQINIHVGVLGSFILPEPVEVNANYMVVPWGIKPVDATLREGNYLIVEKERVEVNNEPKGFDPYVSSHPITTTITRIEYMNYSNVTPYKMVIENSTYPRRAYYYVQNSSGQWVQTTVDGRSYTTISADWAGFTVSSDASNVILNHTIPSTMYVPYDVTVEVRNSVGSSETVVFTQYPPIYISGERSNGYAWVNGWSNNRGGDRVCYDDRGEYNYNARIGNFSYRNNAVMGTGDNRNPNNYIISISSFSDDTYKIGDPRSSTVNNLTNLSGLTSYKPTRRDGTEDMIAPRILVASSYGVITSTYYFDQDAAEKRCASYQENGYPAGRWRVPTAAEIEFIMSLHAQGYIPSLFNLGRNDRQGYWCANGKISGDANARPYLSNDTQDTAVRCVYDIWYWGEKHEATEFTWGDVEN